MNFTHDNVIILNGQIEEVDELRRVAGRAHLAFKVRTSGPGEFDVHHVVADGPQARLASTLTEGDYVTISGTIRSISAPRKDPYNKSAFIEFQSARHLSLTPEGRLSNDVRARKGDLPATRAVLAGRILSFPHSTCSKPARFGTLLLQTETTSIDVHEVSFDLGADESVPVPHIGDAVRVVGGLCHVQYEDLRRRLHRESIIDARSLEVCQRADGSSVGYQDGSSLCASPEAARFN
jgi:hypothetical protein